MYIDISHQLPASYWNEDRTVFCKPADGASPRKSLGFTVAGYSAVRPYPKLSAPAPRIDKKPADYLRRVLTAVKISEDDRARVTPYLNAQLGAAWKLLTTDGSRAVVVPATDGRTLEVKLPSFLRQRPTTAITVDDTFHLALKRMAAAAPDARPTRPARVTLRLVPSDDSGTLGELRLSVTNIDDGIEASEWMEVQGVNLRTAAATFNIRYIDDVLGRWPLTIRCADGEQPWHFENDVLSYVLMPFDDSETKKQDAVFMEAWTVDGPVTKARQAKPRTVKAAAGPATDLPRIAREVDAHTFTRLDEAYSADRIAMGKPVKALTLGDGTVTVTVISGTGSRQVEAYRLVALEQWPASAGAPQTYAERSKSSLRGDAFYPGMKVTYQGATYVLSAERYVFTVAQALPATPTMTISYGSTPIARVPAPLASPAAPTPTPHSPLPAAAKRATVKVTGDPITWHYEWIEYGTKAKVEGEVTAVNEKAARAAIRAKHGFEKWLPDRTKVEAVQAVAS